MLRSTRLRGSAAALGLGLVLAACGGAAAQESAISEPTDTTQPSDTAQPSDAAQSTEATPPSVLRGEFTSLAGDTIDLGSLEGQDVVLWFWAPW